MNCQDRFFAANKFRRFLCNLVSLNPNLAFFPSHHVFDNKNVYNQKVLKFTKSTYSNTVKGLLRLLQLCHKF